MLLLKSIQDFVQKKFPTSQVIPLVGGGTNSLYLLKNSNLQSVIKIAMISNENARIEYECLGVLIGSSLAPDLYDSFYIDGRLALHLEFVEGNTFLNEILDMYNTNNYEAIYLLFRSLGYLLGNLHKQNYKTKGTIPEIEPIIHYKSFIASRLYEQSNQLVSYLKSIKKHKVLLHGDYGYHNVIMQESGTYRIIDWELAGYGDPRIDIGNVLFWTHLHFSEIAGVCVNNFIEAYLTINELECSPDIMHSFVIIQIWRILDLVNHDFPEHVKSEWSRRLEWALNYKFI